MTDIGSGSTALRSSSLGVFTAAHIGETHRLTGWVHRRRNLGGLLFLDLRDRSGLLQVSVGPDWTEAESLEIAEAFGHEDVVAVEGTIVERPDPNPELPTGAVELRAVTVRRLNKAATPAIPVYRGPEDELPSEELRLQHRVLDLRRAELQANLALRHRLILAVRNYMDGIGFVEVETPILTKPTPEGARDFVVPSSSHPGEFFALPQSPQIYKQILMVAGFDRYFQIARCFRDEALRADRQLEFTQIDVEASFVGVDDILTWMEGLMAELARVGGVPAPLPFPRMTWDEAMERYGSDRPDLRWELEITDFSAALDGIDFRVTQSALDAGGRVRGFRLAGGASLSRRQIEAIEERAKKAGAPGLLWAKRTDEGGSGPLSRFLDESRWQAIGAEPDDLFLMAAGADGVTSPALDAVRAAAIEALELERVRDHAWLWVTDFPVFEAEDDGGLAPNHHPFVQPRPEFIDSLSSDPLAARGDAYDLVYNGTELGSGSIRIHDSALQRRIFTLLGLGDDEIEQKFGFLLRALEAGAPPHGGVAFGMDRIVQRFAGATSLRDVIAFPKTTAARALFEGAPVPIAPGDLADLGLALRGASIQEPERE
ncbi:aspartate--tRNA ligase [Gaopeijia maritima]|uniref:aspartate--tRNA ligase n=1 Tax=Gaopeijia maritima TaxID=3119007 RepID=UPI00326FF443